MKVQEATVTFRVQFTDFDDTTDEQRRAALREAFDSILKNAAQELEGLEMILRVKVRVGDVHVSEFVEADPKRIFL